MRVQKNAGEYTRHGLGDLKIQSFLAFYIVFYMLYILWTYLQIIKNIVFLRQGASWFSAANQGDNLHGVQGPRPRELQLPPAL